MSFDNIFIATIPDTPHTGSLFLQPQSGLIDSITCRNPEIRELYKKQKSLDWDENEFSLSTCVGEFQTCSPTTYDIMIKTLAWQWEADSIAAYNIIPIVAPFISSTELWIAWVKVGEIENLHALTYSEIVRNSFADPALVMAEILAETEALKRISTVARAFSKIKDISLRVATGEISRDSDEAYDAIMLFVCVNLIMERVQFMASFAITFAVAETGAFLPIGQYVQKICTDELQIHVKLNKAILNNELRLSRGKASYARIKSTVNQIYDEVMQSELDWTDYTLPPGKELIGVDAPSIKAWQLFNGADVVDFLNLTPAIPVVRSNPLPWIKGWIDINLIQGSPQEARPGNYLLGGVVDTAANRVFDIDF